MINNLDQDMFSYIRSLEERLERLESLQSSIRHPVADDLRRGRAMSSNGVPFVLVTESGLEVPGIPGTPLNVGTIPSSTGSSSSWDLLYVISFAALGADAFTMRSQLAATTGSPGSVSFRLRATKGQFPFDTAVDATSDEYNILSVGAGAVSLYHNWNWEHGLALTTDPVFIAVEGRVNSGTGTYTAYQPIYGNLIGKDMVSATTAGF